MCTSPPVTICWDGKTGDYVVIPPQRHSLQAVDDSVVMLTVFKSLPSV